MNNIIQFPSKKEGRFDFMTKADFEKYGKIPFVIPQSMHERIQEEVLRQIRKKRKNNETIIENRNMESDP